MGELRAFGFDSEARTQMIKTAQQMETSVHAMQERLDILRAQLGGIDFSYADPWKGFDRRNVKGVVAKLFDIKPDFASFHRALEVCAGGRLFFVVTSNEETGKALLERGQLRITKVINMKPQETLGMIEEAAGTRMYENKKAGAVKTLEKKQNKK